MITKVKAKALIERFEHSITELEDIEMTQEEFEEYCDCAYTCIAYLRVMPYRKNRG